MLASGAFITIKFSSVPFCECFDSTSDAHKIIISILLYVIIDDVISKMYRKISFILQQVSHQIHRSTHSHTEMTYHVDNALLVL